MVAFGVGPPIRRAGPAGGGPPRRHNAGTPQLSASRAKFVARTVQRCRCSGETPVDRDKYETYKALLDSMMPLRGQELKQAIAYRADDITSGFMFWLSDLERQAVGPEKQELSELAGEVVYMKEWLDYKANQALLPSLAASLAQRSYREWQEETGQAMPEVAPGLSIEQLYKLSEVEERKLRDQQGKQERAASSLDDFSSRNKMYADLASGAIQRVRERLMGFAGSGESAADQILEDFLTTMASREERATFLPEAFTPPGVQVQQQLQPQADTGADAASPVYLMTTPEELLRAVETRLGRAGTVNGQQPSTAGTTDVPDDGGRRGDVGDRVPGGEGPDVISSRSSTVSGSDEGCEAGAMLPSGESLQQVLQDMRTDILEYNEHVYRHQTPLERYGQSWAPLRYRDEYQEDD